MLKFYLLYIVMAKRIDLFNLPYRPNLSIPKEKVDSLFGLMNQMDTQQIKQFSIINNIPLNVDDNNGENLIHKAINIENILKKELHRLNIIKFLVQNGVNPDKPNKDNQTPLHLACKNQYSDIVEYLLSLGVNLNYQDNYGAVPFHYALQGKINLLEEEKDIQDFIPKEKKINEIKKNELIQIKKELWEIIKDNQFIDAIKNTIDNSIYSDEQIKNKALEFHKKLAMSNINITSDKYLKDLKENIEILRNSINTIVEKKWEFSDIQNIVIHEKTNKSININDNDYSYLSDIDVKQQIKNKIKNNIDEIKQICSEDLQNKFYLENTDTNLLNKLVNIYQHLVNTNRNIFKNNSITKPTSFIKTSGNFQNLDAITNENMSKNSFDMADNIIDWDNLIFYGGSREIDVVYDFLQIKNIINLDTIEKKVLYILFNDIKNTFTGVSLDINNLPKSFSQENKNIITLAYKFIFNISYSNLRNINDSLSLDKWLNKFDRKDISKASLFYGLYTAYHCLNPTMSTQLSSSILNLANAIAYSEKNKSLLQDELNNTFKKYLIAEILDNKFTFSSSTSNITEKLFACINVLLSEKLSSDLNSYVTNSNNDDIKMLINNLNENNKNEKYIELQKLIMNKIHLMNCKPMENDVVSLLLYINKNCFNENFYRNNKCDNIYYKINELPDIKTLLPINKVVKIYNEEIINRIIYLLESKNNIVLIQYIYLLLELEYIDNALKTTIELFCLNKMKESNHLGLYFNGLLPALPVITNINDSLTRLYVPLYTGSSYKFKNSIDLNDDNIPLIGNYVKLDAGITLDTPQKLNIYFTYIEGRYRPPIYDIDVKYDNLSLKINRDKKNILNILNKILYTGENQLNLYNALESNIKLSSIFTFGYSLITLLTDIIDNDIIKKYINNIIRLLNNYNANLLLYYYIFSPDKLYKIPNFNYYELPETNKTSNFLYFNDTNNIDLNNIDSVSTGVLETDISKNSLLYVLNNFGKIKKIYENIQNNIILGNYNIRKESLIQAKKSRLPPSLKSVLIDFYRYNLINLLVSKQKDIEKMINRINELNLYEDSSITLFDRTISGNFILAKLVEELVKEHMKYYIQSQTFKILRATLNNKNEKIIPIESLLLPPMDFNLSLNNVSINEDNLKIEDINLSSYQFSKDTFDNKEKFIIYPEEYANSEILKVKYELMINVKSFEKLLEDNANPYVLDANNQSPIYSILKLHNYKIINKLKENLDFRVYNDIDGNLSAYNFLLNELENHTQKITNNKTLYNEWIENFVIYQKNEVKTLILSNDKFGNNIPQYLEDSFNVICYLTNQYLSESIFKMEENDELLTYLDLSNFKFNEYLFINEQNNFNIYKSEEGNIIQDIIDNLKNEINKIYIKKNKLNKGESKNQFNKMINKLERKIEIYESFIITGKLDESLNKKILNNNKILKRYESIADIGILTKILSKLIKSNNLNESKDLLSYKIINNEIELFKNKTSKFQNNDINIIKRFYEHTNNISSIYFEFGNYCNNNKVLTFVRELLIFMTSRFILYPFYLLLIKILTLHFQSILPNNTPTEINEKVIYCLTNDLLKEKSIKNILLNEISKKLVLNAVSMFDNKQEEYEFTQQSTKEILDSITDLLTINPVLSISSESPIMRSTIKEINAYFDTFTNKTILNWLVVIENVFKFNINQGRIFLSIHNLLFN